MTVVTFLTFSKKGFAYSFHINFLQDDSTVNKEYYHKFMSCLRKAKPRKRQDLLQNDPRCFLKQLLVHDFLVLIMSQPPYSSDMTVYDSFLFPKLKQSMKCWRFCWKLRQYLQKNSNSYHKGHIKSAPGIRKRAGITEGDQFEANKIYFHQ